MRYDDDTHKALEIQGSRLSWERWRKIELEYADKKFWDEWPKYEDQLEATYDLELYWYRQITQYLDRAKSFLQLAKSFRLDMEPARAEQLEKMALQMMAKCAMTAGGLVESSMRIWGDLPKPGVPSGVIEEWS